MSHTPGPWRLFSDVCPFSHNLSRIKASDGETGIAAANGPCKDATALANARLLTAAPELLDALQKLTTDIATNPALMDAINLADYEDALAAIAKARGQS